MKSVSSVAAGRSLERRLRRLWAKVRKLPDLEDLRANGLTLGVGCDIQNGVFIDPGCCWLIVIGEHCTIAPGVMILAHDASTKRSIGYTRVDRTLIGDRVYIGARAIILPGVTVHSDAIIGAGSVVTRDVPAGQIVAGNPARPLGSVSAFAEKHRRALASKPLFSGPEWRFATGISAERKTEMRQKLSYTDGYAD